MKKLIFLLLVATFLAAGCNIARESLPKEMPDDFAFSIKYGVNSRNVIDTFEGIVVKDLVTAGTAEAKLHFTEEELQSIYDQMAQINILGSLKLVKDTGCRVIPYGVDIWHIRINGVEKKFQWSGEYCDQTKDVQKLIELRNFIVNVVKAKDEYIALPNAAGGYD